MAYFVIAMVDFGWLVVGTIENRNVNDWEFQPFALVDGHDFDGGVLRGDAEGVFVRIILLPVRRVRRIEFIVGLIGIV